MKSAIRECSVSLKNIAGLFLLAGFAGCSASNNRAAMIDRGPDDPSRFKVSVVTDGHAVKNLNQDLVHRITIPPAKVDQFISGWPEQLQRLGGTKVEYDSQGKYMGIRVLGGSGNAPVPVLGLSNRDVITAVGTTPVKTENDLLDLFRTLKKSGFVTMTVERSGTPHKYLYYSGSK